MNMTVLMKNEEKQKEGTDYRDIVKAAGFSSAAIHEKQAIIYPAVLEAYRRAAQSSDFDEERFLDFGCGPGYIAAGFVNLFAESKNSVVAYDSSEGMITLAREQVEPPPLEQSQHFYSSDYQKVKQTLQDQGGATFAVLSFVHTSMDSKKDLNNLFKKVSDLMAPGGTLIVIGATPAGLNKRHVTCEYDIENPSALSDGQLYTGRIYDGKGNSVFEVKDRFWSLHTVSTSAVKNNFSLENGVTSIPDQESMFSPRKKNKEGVDPFCMLTFKKKHAQPTSP